MPPDTVIAAVDDLLGAFDNIVLRAVYLGIAHRTMALAVASPTATSAASCPPVVPTLFVLCLFAAALSGITAASR